MSNLTSDDLALVFVDTSERVIPVTAKSAAGPSAAGGAALPPAESAEPAEDPFGNACRLTRK